MIPAVIALYVYSYLVGSVPTAYIIGRVVKGIDIRRYGSGNVGGSNVYYHVGKFWIVPLGLFELFVKGGSPVWIGHFALGLGWDSYLLALAPLFAVAGHNWSVFLRFQGGRGVAVSIGALFAIFWQGLVFFAAVAGGGWLVFRSSAVWVYIGLLLLPLWSLLLKAPHSITWFTVGVLVLITAKRLLANWERLPAGVPLGRALWNRLWLDRDIPAREEWVFRRPEGGVPRQEHVRTGRGS